MNIYQIPKITRTLTINAQWQKWPWSEIPALQIDQFSGERPIHVPQAQAKLAYDDEALYMVFQVKDRFVRAKSQHYQDEVFHDSCVEFFFTPGEDLTQGYFNLEVNCGGTALFHHQKGRGIEDTPIAPADFADVQIAHSLPKIVDPEISEAVNWTLEYKLPFKTLSDYAQAQKPQTGTSWRANLYKCADECSAPHWLTWSPVDTPAPDFHRPEFFGKLIFA